MSTRHASGLAHAIDFLPNNCGIREANLYDVDAKYGDVVPVGEVLEYLDALAPTGLARG